MKSILSSILVMLFAVSALADITLPPVGSSSNNPAAVIYVGGTNTAPKEITPAKITQWDTGITNLTAPMLISAGAVTNVMLNGVLFTIVNGVATGSITVSASTPVTLDLTSSDSMLVNASAYRNVEVALGADVWLEPPTNATRGTKLEWDFYGNGGDYWVGITNAQFIIPESSTVSNVFIVSNNYVNVLLMAPIVKAGVTNWLVESYVPQYKIPTP